MPIIITTNNMLYSICFKEILTRDVIRSSSILSIIPLEMLLAELPEILVKLFDGKTLKSVV